MQTQFNLKMSRIIGTICLSVAILILISAVLLPQQAFGARETAFIPEGDDLLAPSIVLTTATPSPIPPITATVTPAALIYLPNIMGSGSQSTIPTRTPSPTPETNGCVPATDIGPSDEDVDKEIQDGINNERFRATLAPYANNDQLIQAARRHAEDMALNNALSHTGSDGSSADQRIREACYTPGRTGEIIGWGFPDADAMLTWWMNSDAHRSNILHEVYRDFGVAYRREAGSQFTHYWVVTFGKQQEDGRSDEIYPYRCIYSRIGDGYGASAMIEQWEPCN